MRRNRCFVALAMAVLCLSACGQAKEADKSNAAAPTVPSPQVTGTGGSTESVPAGKEIKMVDTTYLSTFQVELPDGTSFETKMSTAGLRKAEDLLATGMWGGTDAEEALLDETGSVSVLTSAGANGCQVNMERDAVIPVTYHFSPTTEGDFSTELNVSVDLYRDGTLLSGTPGPHPSVRQQVTFGSQDACFTATGVTADQSSLGTFPDEGRWTGSFALATGFIIVDDYFTPAHPNGNVSLLRGLGLRVSVPNTMYRAVYSAPTGLFKVVHERNPIKNDGSRSTVGVEASLRAISSSN